MPMEWNGSAIGEIDDKAGEALRMIGLAMVRDIHQSMRATQRKASGVSVAGHPPAPQTGNLISAVIMDDTKAERGKVCVGVATTAPYGEYLENPKPERAKHRRPFLEPAMQRAVDAMGEMIRSVE